MADVFDRSGAPRLLAGSLWFLFFMIVGGGVWWLLTVALSRRYGPEGYGIFNTAASLTNFAWIIIFGGVYEGLIKYGSEYLNKNRDKMLTYFASSINYLSVIGAMLCIILVLLSLLMNDLQMRIFTITMAVFLLFSGFKDSIASIVGSLQKTDYLSLIESSRLFFVFLAGVFFISLALPVVYTPFLLLVGLFGQLLLSIYLLRNCLLKSFWFKLKDLLKQKTSFKLFKEVYIFGLFISLGMISFNVMKSLDVLVLKLFFDYESVGIYSVADGYSSLLFYVTSIALPLIPAISEAYAKKNKKLLKEYIDIAIKYSLIIGILLTILVMTAAERFVIDVYGRAFAPAVLPLRILMIGTLMLMLSYNFASVLIGIGQAKLSGKIFLGAAVQYIVSLFVLVPLFGFVGAAAALTLTGLSTMLFVPYYVHKLTKVAMLEDVWKLAVAAAATFLFLYLAPKFSVWVVLADAAVGIVAFAYLLYLTGYVSEKDLKLLRVASTSFRLKK